MRFILIFTLFFGLTSFAFAESETKSEWVNTTSQHVQHPPHDHPDNDHIKKLDEWLRKSRKQEDDDSEDECQEDDESNIL